MRAVKPCAQCGRPIYWDHGFSTRNLDAHERACADQRAREREMIAARARRNAVRQQRRWERAVHVARVSGVGSTVIPSEGQLVLIEDDNDEEVE